MTFLFSLPITTQARANSMEGCILIVNSSAITLDQLRDSFVKMVVGKQGNDTGPNSVQGRIFFQVSFATAFLTFLFFRSHAAGKTKRSFED